MSRQQKAARKRNRVSWALGWAGLVASAALAGTVSLSEPALGAGLAMGQPAAEPLAKSARPQVTFTGFHVFDDGSSRIWVRLTHTVDVQEKLSKGTAVYVLKGALVPGKNNKNPLVTTYFDSAVMKAKLVQNKKDAELVVTLKQEVTPKHRVVSRPDGTSSVQIDFPPPPVKQPPPPDPVPPQPKEPPKQPEE
jgi:hypothetical protein